MARSSDHRRDRRRRVDHEQPAFLPKSSRRLAMRSIKRWTRSTTRCAARTAIFGGSSSRKRSHTRPSAGARTTRSRGLARQDRACSKRGSRTRGKRARRCQGDRRLVETSWREIVLIEGLLDARRSYPHSSRVELEKARRRTDAADRGALERGRLLRCLGQQNGMVFIAPSPRRAARGSHDAEAEPGEGPSRASAERGRRLRRLSGSSKSISSPPSSPKRKASPRGNRKAVKALREEIRDRDRPRARGTDGPHGCALVWLNARR